MGFRSGDKVHVKLLNGVEWDDEIAEVHENIGTSYLHHIFG